MILFILFILALLSVIAMIYSAVKKYKINKKFKIEFLGSEYTNPTEYYNAKNRYHNVLITANTIIPSKENKDDALIVNIDLTIDQESSPFYIVFDVETTGLIPFDKNYANLDEWPRVVQIAWVITDSNFNVIKHKQFLIKQVFEIPEKASSIHGITKALTIEKGVGLSVAIEAFLDDLRRINYVVCHNYEFDFGVLKAECLRLGLKLPRKKKICTMLKGKKYADVYFDNSYKLKYPKLEELFGRAALDHTMIKVINSHDAMVDTLMTLFCLRQLYIAGELQIDNTEEY